MAPARRGSESSARTAADEANVIDSTNTNGYAAEVGSQEREGATSTILGVLRGQSRAGDHGQGMRSSVAKRRASSATGSSSPCASCTQQRPSDPGRRLRDESRLPITRRSGNQHHPAALHDLPQRSEASPRHRIGPNRRYQHRRFQQTPTLERRRRAGDSSDLCLRSTAGRRDPETRVAPTASGAARAQGTPAAALTS